MQYKVQYIKPDTLKELPENPRKHPEQLITKIEKSMSKFGFVAPIIALKKSKEIIAGHGRLKTAKKMNMSKVPVIFLDMDRTDGIEYAIADNKLQQDSMWDFEKLNEIFKDDDLQIDVTGFDNNEIKAVMDKFSMDLEFIEGDNNESQDIDTNDYAQTSNIKMLQLYFTMEAYTEVIEQCTLLMDKYNLDNVTDVVKRAVENEYNKCK